MQTFSQTYFNITIEKFANITVCHNLHTHCETSVFRCIVGINISCCCCLLVVVMVKLDCWQCSFCSLSWVVAWLFSNFCLFFFVFFNSPGVLAHRIKVDFKRHWRSSVWDLYSKYVSIKNNMEILLIIFFLKIWCSSTYTLCLSTKCLDLILLVGQLLVAQGNTQIRET